MKKSLWIFILALALLVSACDAPKPEPVPVATPTVEPAADSAPSPRQALEYRLDAAKENPAGDFYPAPDEAFVQKVNDIFTQYAHPQNDAFENALGLYQYISQNLVYNAEGPADTEKALTAGSANAEGFARAYQYLLNQVGIESYLAVSDDNAKVWVMAILPDGAYHFDAADEAQKTQGQSLEFFAMNDEQRWDGGRISGWHLRADAGSNPADAPKNENQTYWYIRNIRSGYGIDVENDCLYFADVSQDNELVRFNYATGAEEALYGIHAGTMVYYRGTVYYSDTKQRNQLFRLDPRTGQTELLDSVYVTRMMIKNGQLIYFDDVSSSEKGIQLN